ncbi:MAG TPA: hypothetical protein VFL03_07045 [Candidatus Limnocylindrales bacterium]|nr:hypothetical protein [Candidatus Limnocylindrales bacterium]
MTPLEGTTPMAGTPVESLSLVGSRRRPVKIVEHPAFRGHPRHEHPHAGFPPAFLALPVRVVSLNDLPASTASATLVATASANAGAPSTGMPEAA